ncbi:hypothetical protein AUTU_01380 [Aureibacter tunicatorum]|nr:hypothetical protein AUTU_01380 [Aureibacter tunicatorum]
MLFACCSLESAQGQTKKPKTKKEKAYVPNDSIPDAIRSNFQKAFPDALTFGWYASPSGVNWESYGVGSGPWYDEMWDNDIWMDGYPGEGITYPNIYEVEYKYQGHDCYSVYSAEGMLLQTRVMLDLESLPKVVSETFHNGPFANYKVKSVSEEIRPGRFDVYRIIVKKGLFGRHVIYYGKDGKQLKHISSPD